MTLSAALSSATSSLRAIQTRMAVASSNIANADDVNYTAKSAKQSAVVAGGATVGVRITAVESEVDSNLVRGIVEATSADGAAQTLKNYLQRLSNALGSLSSDGAGDTLATALSSLEGTLDELATTPESATLKDQAVTDLDDAAAALRGTSQDIQGLRADADAAIADSVATVNDALHEIDALNDAIMRAQAAGEPISALEDKRNAALQAVANELDVSTYTDANGAMKVYTSSGQLLVGNEVHELAFTEAGSVTAAASYPAGLSGVSVDGQDITGTIRSGALASLVALRDVALPSVQQDLDAVANELRDTMNAIANQGSAAPPPNTLTGTRAVAASDTLSASGTLRVAITDADGKTVATQDFNLSSYASVGDLLTALNTVPGLSASLNGEGKLVLDAASAANGVAVAGGSIGGKTASGYFGLNDVVSGTGASNLSVAPHIAANPVLFPTGTLSTSGTLALGDVAVSKGSGTQAQAMADALRAADLAGDAGALVSDVAAALSSAKTRASSTGTSLSTLVDSFSSQYGVNVDEETARIADLQNAYSASAQVLSAVQSMFDDLLQAVR